MLLIDGVRYQEWEISNEDELEQMVIEHAQDIFGENSIYFDKKQKLRSLSGIGSIPDGYVIILEDLPHWHIVEVELSSHPLHDHIVSQVGRFISGISNQNIQRGIVNAMDEGIARDDFIKLRLRKAIDPAEIYRFLTDLISKPPILTIVIEKNTEELREALNTLRYPQIKVVEFQTFTRAGVVGLSVHAHLFEPLDKFVVPARPQSPVQPTPELFSSQKTKAGTVKFNELISRGWLKDGQVLYFYHTRPFTDERAQVIGSSNKMKYEADGKTYSKSELATILLRKHDFKHDQYSVRGSGYWKTEDGELLLDLEEQVRSLRGDRK